MLTAPVRSVFTTLVTLVTLTILLGLAQPNSARAAEHCPVAPWTDEFESRAGVPSAASVSSERDRPEEAEDAPRTQAYAPAMSTSNATSAVAPRVVHPVSPGGIDAPEAPCAPGLAVAPSVDGGDPAGERQAPAALEARLPPSMMFAPAPGEVYLDRL
ncbi:MAG: hypothetical protein AAF928_17170, partial [Myxococcota bacterium]